MKLLLFLIFLNNCSAQSKTYEFKNSFYRTEEKWVPKNENGVIKIYRDSIIILSNNSKKIFTVINKINLFTENDVFYKCENKKTIRIVLKDTINHKIELQISEQGTFEKYILTINK